MLRKDAQKQNKVLENRLQYIEQKLMKDTTTLVAVHQAGSTSQPTLMFEVHGILLKCLIS